MTVRTIVILALLSLVAQSPGAATGKHTRSIDHGAVLQRKSLTGRALLHTATLSNTVLFETYLDTPLANDNPDILVFVTQVWNPAGGLSGISNPSEIGVRYASSSGRWSIFNEDLAAMPIGASFNILLLDKGPLSFVHTSTETGSFGTTIDHASINAEPGAHVLITHNRNPFGGSGARHDHPLQLNYTDLFLGTPLERWIVLDQDEAEMPAGTSFNVVAAGLDADLAPGILTHVATVGNIVLGNRTRIDDARTNGRPDVRLFVNLLTDNIFGGATDPSPIGVLYDEVVNRWTVFNEDGAAMPEGAKFHVVVIGADWIFADDFESGGASSWSASIP